MLKLALHAPLPALLLLATLSCTSPTPPQERLINPQRVVSREGFAPLRKAQPVGLSPEQLNALKRRLLDALERRHQTTINPHQLALFRDERAHTVAFLLYDLSPLEAWEAAQGDSIAQLDAQLDACEQGLSGTTHASDADYRRCLQEAYPSTLHPYLSEISGAFCVELRLARFDLSAALGELDDGSSPRRLPLRPRRPAHATPPAPPQEALEPVHQAALRQVHDLTLHDVACDLSGSSPLLALDATADGLIELAFHVEMNAPARHAGQVDPDLGLSGFLVDASSGQLQWSERFGSPLGSLGHFRLVPGLSSTQPQPYALEIERLTLRTRSRTELSDCQGELVAQIMDRLLDQEATAWESQPLEPPQGCRVDAKRERLAFHANTQRWSASRSAKKP